jgi:hypothetical protein
MTKDERAAVDGLLEIANVNLILAFSLICSVNLRYAA